MVGKKGAGRFDVADARELQLKPYALLVTLAAELVHLGAQLLGGIGGLALELGGPDAALVELHLVVLARLRNRVTTAQSALLAPICLCADWFCLSSYDLTCFNHSATGFVSFCMTSFSPPFRSDRQRKARALSWAGVSGCVVKQWGGRRWSPVNKTGEVLLQHEKQISSSSGYGNIEFCFGAALKFCRRIAKPFLHIPRGEDGNVVKSQAF